ncbi:MAG: bifunctional phosphoribosylaminoimidazolecarboxamide formyltransferase/inosine monophosphate cyclohydrolase [Chloroflexi bacterium]|nr:bifunctional phosphoribosylaminoimidazolecarboxamide formyltransferase/inosine monophosphate cyclohydrolase [Chloroflexota bacterium]
MKAILSVYDKTGIEELAKVLSNNGFDLISTGGTYKKIIESASLANVKVLQVSDITKSPEILDGRVKTLHPKIHGGILARKDLSSHREEIEKYNIDFIDMVVVNLYPFLETISKPDVTLEEALENIDIGGPTLIRAAAKNYKDVLVVVDPSDYEWIKNKIVNKIAFTKNERKNLARKAFSHVAFYDSAIASWLNDTSLLDIEEFTTGFKKLDTLRYGENPHQEAGIYTDTLGSGGIARVNQLHGMPMSYTNYLDADGAWTAVTDFTDPACVIVKHTNPCGISINEDQVVAYKNAFSGDSVSAYGGIVAFNREVSTETAEAMKGVLFDIIIAPKFEDGALNVFKKRKRTRILQANTSSGNMADMSIKSISGGVLIQTKDKVIEKYSDWKVVTNRAPTEKEWKDLYFSWQCCKHIKSNTIVLAKNNTLVGMGAGQPNRVVSVHLALRIAGNKSKESALASDAFMPFADNIEMAAKGGVTAVVQPGGSIRDQDVIDEANKFNIAMVFTGIRHFNH